MPIRHLAAYAAAGLFWVNCIPHIVQGVSGSSFQSPFAHPPGQGLSSPEINVMWGCLNLLVGYLFITRVGSFDWRKWRHITPFFVAFVLGGLLLAHSFAPFHR